MAVFHIRDNMNQARDEDSGHDEHDLLGKSVLVGLTIFQEGQGEPRRDQVHGVIVTVNPEIGVEVRLEGLREGEVLALPPSFHIFARAKPGCYTLKDTGETITDPHLLAQYQVHQHPDQTETWQAIEPPSST